VIRELVKLSSLPVNIMAGPGAPAIAQLTRLGVRRISIGTAVAEAAYALTEHAAREVLTLGTYDHLGPGGWFSSINSAFD
jgi:2-methylisocitrate lyase-like PEP mutase family enzyme